MLSILRVHTAHNAPQMMRDATKNPEGDQERDHIARETELSSVTSASGQATDRRTPGCRRHDIGLREPVQEQWGVAGTGDQACDESGALGSDCVPDVGYNHTAGRRWNVQFLCDEMIRLQRWLVRADILSMLNVRRNGRCPRAQAGFAHLGSAFTFFCIGMGCLSLTFLHWSDTLGMHFYLRQ